MKRTLEKSLNKRIASLSSWLKKHAPTCKKEQAHLKKGSRERAYWNYGYLIALCDVRDLLEILDDTLN